MGSKSIGVLLLLLTFSACQAETGDVAALIAQLQGQHCRFAWVWDRRTRTQRCVRAGPEPLRWLITAGVERDCDCRGRAAQCLVSLGDVARDAVPALAVYLRDGPSNVDNGDGGATCLSTVVLALGRLGDPRAIPALATYIQSPRRERRLSGMTSHPGGYSGLREAIDTLASFRLAARQAVPALRGLLGSTDREILAFRPQVLKALHALGDEQQLDHLGPDLEQLAEIVSRPADRPVNEMTSELIALQAVSSALEILDAYAKQGRPAVEPYRGTLRSMLGLYETKIPAWLKAVSAHPIHPALSGWSLESLERPLTSIRGLLMRVLLRLRDPAAFPHFVALLDDPALTREDAPWLAAAYPEMDKLIPELVRKALDLQFGDRPLRETVDGRKRGRATLIIHILNARGTTRARQALAELAQNAHLRRDVETVLAPSG